MQNEIVEAIFTRAMPVHLIDRLECKLQPLNRKALKLGLPPVVLSVSNFHTEKVSVCVDTLLMEWVHYDREMAVVTVSGSLPKLPDWEPLGRIDVCDNGEVMTAPFPGQAVPDAHRHGDMTCDHCKVRNSRKNVFVLRNRNDGSHVRVGRNCLADFIRSEDPSGLFDYLMEAAKIGGYAGDDDGDFRSGPDEGENPLVFCCMVAAFIRVDGWIPKSKAIGRNSTCQSVQNQLYLYRRGPAKDIRRDVAVEEKDCERAKLALEWARALPNCGDEYKSNLGVACRQSEVNEKTSGLVASAVQAYSVEMSSRLEREKAAGNPGKHLGTVDVRSDFPGLRVVKMLQVPSQFGMRNGIKFEDSEGNNAMWWTTGDVEWLKLGEVYDVTGTVESHGDYRGQSQTVLQRVKPTKPKPVGKERAKKKKEVSAD